MARVLVVDDEQRYRELITRILSGEGHETSVAASGREALDVGTRYRPDVLVTDWMLKDDIHGLHVVNVMGAVLPETRAIMMTGFASEDLREGAGKAGVHAFLEKPFGADQILAAVREAVASGEALPETLRPKLAMLETDAAGAIVFANRAARDMMAETEAGRDAGNLVALLADEAAPILDAAMDRWVAVLPRADGHKRWHLRSQEPLNGGSRLVVLRRWDEPQHLGLALVEMLLGATDIEHARWPLDGRVLVVDDEAWLRSHEVSLVKVVSSWHRGD